MMKQLNRVRSRNHSNRNAKPDPTPETRKSSNSGGHGGHVKVTPASGSDGSPDFGGNLPELLAMKDQWLLLVEATGGKYLLRVDSLVAQPLPLPPIEFADSFIRAWVAARSCGFSNRWALRDKDRYLATTAFAAVIREHLSLPRSMFDIVVEKVAV